jgi:hypothetical protein
MQSALLGSVSAVVSAHAGRPVLIIHQRTQSNQLTADGHGQRQSHSERASPSDGSRAAHH